MTNVSEANQIKELIDQSNDVLIVQADNPDGDSLASALALEAIIHDLGKSPHLYCGIDIPTYLRYLEGWSRVNKELPTNFDCVIIVDCSTITLLETASKNNLISKLSSKPTIIIDHHKENAGIEFAKIVCNYPVVATGELIFELATTLNWPLSLDSKELIAISIMSDSLGLVSEATTARSIEIIAKLVEGGVSLASLDNARRKMMQKSPSLVKYKGQLLQRIEYHFDNKIATITIPQNEIEQYSPSYNPPMLVIDDMRMTENTEVAIAFKTYKDGKITAKIRSNYGYPISAELAAQFGGGGHDYASGFKITDGRDYSQIKKECLEYAINLINKTENKK